MKMLFKQRLFSWFDSYDVYNDKGETIFTVDGKFSWGHKLHILNNRGEHIATVKQVVLAFTPRFELYVNKHLIGTLQKKISFFKPHYEITFNGWNITGNILEWDYEILNAYGEKVAQVNKEIFNLTDTYSIEAKNDSDALYALMVTLAIDAEKCSRKD